MTPVQIWGRDCQQPLPVGGAIFFTSAKVFTRTGAKVFTSLVQKCSLPRGSNSNDVKVTRVGKYISKILERYRIVQIEIPSFFLDWIQIPR